MSAIVLDSSAALSLVLPDERSEEVQAILDAAGDSTPILVPPLWWYECANVLLSAINRRRIEPQEAREAMGALWKVPTRTEGAPGAGSMVHLFHLGVSRKITAYDAAYLALAESSGATLLSLDRKLAEAAAAMHIPVAPS